MLTPQEKLPVAGCAHAVISRAGWRCCLAFSQPATLGGLGQEFLLA
jgi:hypothetical protein